jgi:hypothetical protein
MSASLGRCYSPGGMRATRPGVEGQIRSTRVFTAFSVDSAEHPANGT